MTVGVMAAFRSTGARQHVETLHVIGPEVIIVLMEPFRRPLGTFHQQISSTPRHRVGKKKTQCGFPQLLEAYFTCEPFGSPLILLTVEGPRCPLAGARWICSATVLCGGIRFLPKHTSTRPRLGPHCPTGAMSGGTGCEQHLLWAYHPLCLRTRLVLCMTGVLELDLPLRFAKPDVAGTAQMHWNRPTLPKRR